MNATLRPFDLPVPRGAPPPEDLALVDAPHPSIGEVVCATSTLDKHGYSVLPDDAPSSLAARLAFALFVAVPGGVLAGGLLTLLILRLLPDSAAEVAAKPLLTALALILAAVAFRISFKRWGVGRREGACIYAGTEGVERITYEKGATTHERVTYLDHLIVLSSLETTSINGVYSHDSDMLRFLDPHGAHLLTLVGVYDKAHGPSPEALLVREAAALSAHRRAELVEARLQSGDSVSFPVIGTSGLSTFVIVKRIVLRGDDLEIHPHAGHVPEQRFRVADIGVRVSHGHLEIVPRDASQPAVSFKRSAVSDSDVLMTILPQA